MSFDYSHTCPSIDREIDSAKSNMETFVENIIEELCPYMDFKAEITKDFIKNQSASLYQDLEGCFEEVRKTNEDMRSEAEYQIGVKIEEVEELKDYLAEANIKISELEDQIEV